MMHVYGAQFAKTWTLTSYASFMRVRFARLYPIHITVLALFAVGVLPFALRNPALVDTASNYSLPAFFASLLMLHSPWIDHRTWNYPAWSVSAEWHAYLVFPLLVPFLKNMRRWPAGGIVLLGVFIPFSIYLQQLPADQYPTNGMIVLARVMPFFFAGMALYSLNQARYFVSNVLAVFVIGGTLLCLSYSCTAPFSVLLIPLLVLVVLQNPTVQAVFCSKFLLWLGKISYSLYMTHALIDTFFLGLTLRYAKRYLGSDIASNLPLSLLLWLAGITAALCLGWLAWRWVEVPGRRLLMSKKSRPAAALSS